MYIYIFFLFLLCVLCFRAVLLFLKNETWRERNEVSGNAYVRCFNLKCTLFITTIQQTFHSQKQVVWNQVKKQYCRQICWKSPLLFKSCYLHDIPLEGDHPPASWYRKNIVVEKNFKICSHSKHLNVVNHRLPSWTVGRNSRGVSAREGLRKDWLTLVVTSDTPLPLLQSQAEIPMYTGVYWVLCEEWYYFSLAGWHPYSLSGHQRLIHSQNRADLNI